MLLCPPNSTLFPYTTLFRSYLDIFTTGDIQKLAEKYKKEVEKYIYPNGRNLDLREAEARKIIRTVRKMNITELNIDRKSTRLNSSHVRISYAVFCLKKKRKK